MRLENGEIIEGKITGITKYGAFVSVNGGVAGTTGMIHISEISDGFVKDIGQFLKVNQTVKAVVLSAAENGKLALSLKQLPANETAAAPEQEKISEKSDAVHENPEEFGHTGRNTAGPRSFEDMITKFKRDSDEKISDLKHLEPKRGAPRRRKD